MKNQNYVNVHFHWPTLLELQVYSHFMLKKYTRTEVFILQQENII